MILLKVLAIPVIILFWLYGGCIFSSILKCWWFDKCMASEHKAVARRNAKRAEKYRSQSALMSAAWDGEFEDYRYDWKLAKKLETPATILSFLIMTLVCGAILILLFLL